MHRIGRLAVDKGVANRFIKHAIAQIKFDRPPGQDEGISSQQDVRIPVKVTAKMIARAQYEKELKELGSEEEDDLEVIDDAESQPSSSASPPPDKGKGKASAEDLIADVAQTVAGQKRRRPAVDPFAGTQFPHRSMFLSLYFPLKAMATYLVLVQKAPISWQNRLQIQQKSHVRALPNHYQMPQRLLRKHRRRQNGKQSSRKLRPLHRDVGHGYDQLSESDLPAHLLR